MRSTAVPRPVVVALLGVHLLAFFAMGCGRGLGGGGGWGSEKLAYTPAGELIFYRDQRIRLYDTEARHRPRSVSVPGPLGTNWIPQSAGVAISADGTMLVGATTAGVEVHRVDTGALVKALETESAPDGYVNVFAVAISPDGALVAVAMRHIPDEGPIEELTLWRVADGAQVATIAHGSGRTGPRWSAGLAFSVDGTLLFGTDIAMEGSFLYAWHTADGTLAWGQPMAGPENPRAPARADALAVSADGTTLATASSIVDLWRVSDGARVDRFAAIQQAVPFETVALNADATRAVATHYSNVTSDPLLFGADGSVIHTFPIIASGCTGAVFSPDGTRIASSCAGSLKIWDTATGALVHQRSASD
jgi:WD40 repeat protein